MNQVTNSEMAMVNVHIDNHVDVRAFDYVLNKKKAKSKLLKGAKRESHLELDFKPGCAILSFSDGSYFQLILPLMKDWRERTGNIVKIDSTELKILEVDVGQDKLGQHMDTKLVVIVDNDRLVLHAYNGTENFMVQGKNYEKFATNCLEPYFRKEIKNNIDKITNFNNEVNETLGGKKAIKTSSKPYNCPHCDVKTSTHGDLKLHMKRCHTKPGIYSPNWKKSIKTMNENVSMLEISSVKMIESSSDEKEVPKYIPEIENVITCDICEQDMTDQPSLNDHMKQIHNQGEDVRNCITEDDEIKALGVAIRNENNTTSQVKPSISICGECGLEFDGEKECNKHMTSLHCKTFDPPGATYSSSNDRKQEMVVNCPFCDLVSKDHNQLMKHIENNHIISKSSKPQDDTESGDQKKH